MALGVVRLYDDSSFGLGNSIESDGSNPLAYGNTGCLYQGTCPVDQGTLIYNFSNFLVPFEFMSLFLSGPHSINTVLVGQFWLKSIIICGYRNNYFI